MLKNESGGELPEISAGPLDAAYYHLPMECQLFPEVFNSFPNMTHSSPWARGSDVVARGWCYSDHLPEDDTREAAQKEEQLSHSSGTHSSKQLWGQSSWRLVMESSYSACVFLRDDYRGYLR